VTRQIWNFVLGGAMIVGGLSGKLVLIGTNSGAALAALGAFFVGLGAYRLARERGML
jgi:hypothetical protein